VRPPIRSLHLVFESHDERALVPIPKRSTSAWGDIDTVVVDSLKALDFERPIREAAVSRCSKLHWLPRRQPPSHAVKQ
jgi:hypothetical protein